MKKRWMGHRNPCAKRFLLPSRPYSVPVTKQDVSRKTGTAISVIEKIYGSTRTAG